MDTFEYNEVEPLHTLPVARERLQIISTSPAACSLLNQCFPKKEVAGSVVLPSGALSGLRLQYDHPQNQTCYLYAVEGSTGLVLLAIAQYKVPDEAAAVWARTLLDHVDANIVVALATMQAEQLKGPQDPSQESLLFRLHTSASRQQQGSAQPPAPYLPSGNLISGLAAAVISNRQARQQAGEVLVAVETSPLMVVDSVGSLAAAAAQLCAGLGEAQLAKQLADPSCLAMARKAAATSASYHPTASIFL